MKHPLNRIRLSIVIATLTIGAAIVPIRPEANERARDEQAQRAARATLADLPSVDELKATFNRDAGKVRLVLLLSPT